MRAGDLPSRIPQLALSLRRLLGLAIQVRGLAGAADVLYDRRQAPALAPEQLQVLVNALLDQAYLAMGSPGQAIVLAGDSGALESSLLTRDIRQMASDVVAESGDVSSVLESIALIGRFDFLRRQIQSYATGEHVFEEEMD